MKRLDFGNAMQLDAEPHRRFEREYRVAERSSELYAVWLVLAEKPDAPEEARKFECRFARAIVGTQYRRPETFRRALHFFCGLDFLRPSKRGNESVGRRGLHRVERVQRGAY